MKHLSFFFLFSIWIAQLGLAQNKFHNTVDWDSFKEPDGKIAFLSFSPRLIYGNEQTYGSFFSDLFVNKLKELSILRFTTRLDFRYGSQNDTGSKNFRLNMTPNFNYRRYFKKRRGLFIETENRIYLDGETDKRFLIASDNLLSIGIGRFENVSTVHQGIQIVKTNEGLKEVINLESEDDIFDLATKLRELDYVFLRDSRRLRISQTAQFLDYVKGKGANVSDMELVSSLVDGYVNGRNVNIQRIIWTFIPDDLSQYGYFIPYYVNPLSFFNQGQIAKIGVSQNLNNYGPFQHDLSPSTNLVINLAKTLTLYDRMRVGVYSNTSIRLDYNFTSRYNLGNGASLFYIPDSRSAVGLTYALNIGDDYFSSEAIFIHNISLLATYFINYNSVIEFSSGYRASNTIGNSHFLNLGFTQFIYR